MVLYSKIDVHSFISSLDSDMICFCFCPLSFLDWVHVCAHTFFLLFLFLVCFSLFLEVWKVRVKGIGESYHLYWTNRFLTKEPFPFKRYNSTNSIQNIILKLLLKNKSNHRHKLLSVFFILQTHSLKDYFYE